MTAGERRQTTLAAGVGLLASAFLLALRFHAVGAPMDEGAVLAYAERVLHGAVPGRDFQSFYGPGNSWLLAAVFKVFGVSLTAERIVGLAYRLIAISALLFLVRRRGWVAVLVSGTMLAAVLPGQGTWAWSTYGALACLLAAVAACDLRRPFAAGALFGCAVLMRFDWAPVALLALAPFLVAWPWRERRRAALGFALGVAAYVPHAVLVGPDKLRLLVEQLRATEPGRHLPLPMWQFYPGYVLATVLVGTVALLAVGLRRRRTAEGRVFLSTGLLTVGLLPGIFARPDDAHIVPAGAAAIALLPAVGLALLEELRPFAERIRPGMRNAILIAGAAFAAWTATGWIVGGTFRPLLGRGQFPSYVVTHDGRSFRVDDAGGAWDAEAAVSRVEALARPGQRLFVGPQDLRRTNYGDTFIYYLLPRMRPASFYMELNPRTANLPGSGLARELRGADFLVLTSRYDVWRERNISRLYGSALPNRIVARDFCLRGLYGTYRVLERCGVT